MKTRIHIADLQELIAEAHYPDRFLTQDAGIIERTYSHDILMGKGSYNELFFEGIHIGYGDLALQQPTKLCIESDMETVKMLFTLSGDTLTKNLETGVAFEFDNNHHSIFYTNGFKGIIDWRNKTEMQIFEVNLLPSFFEKYLPDHITAFENFRKQIYKSKQSRLCDCNFQITPQMHLIIREILSSRRHGAYKKMFVEAKVIELLMLQFEQVSAHECGNINNLRKSDIDKMYAVKEIILENLATPISLIELAQQVGTNEFTLKKGFKELFGTTVYGYWNEVKMMESKKLLLEQAHTVSEVSRMIGYKNPQHFSTAFKKHFGISPSKLRS